MKRKRGGRRREEEEREGEEKEESGHDPLYIFGLDSPLLVGRTWGVFGVNSKIRRMSAALIRRLRLIKDDLKSP